MAAFAYEGVRAAEWPADTAEAVRLLTAYRDFLRNRPSGAASIPVPDYDLELQHLSQRWNGVSSVLLLAGPGDAATGCAAVRRLPSRPGAYEVKRLWVDIEGRGTGTGRKLVQAACTWAAAHGGKELLLDTIPEAMPAALRLYESMGFQPVARYNNKNIPGLIFLRRALP